MANVATCGNPENLMRAEKLGDAGKAPCNYLDFTKDPQLSVPLSHEVWLFVVKLKKVDARSSLS
jgi:hypothetical protein